MKMIGTVFFIFVIVCLQYTSGATSNQVQEISMGGRVVSLNYSMLSPSCANETLRLVSGLYDEIYSSLYQYHCSAKNETSGMCLVELFAQVPCENFETKCTNANGQFYTNQTRDDFSACYLISDGIDTTTLVSISNYPICAGASCNASEVENAFVETLSADATDGPMRDSISRACTIYNPLIENSSSTSNSCNRFIGGVITSNVIQFTLSIILTCSVINGNYV